MHTMFDDTIMWMCCPRLSIFALMMSGWCHHILHHWHYCHCHQHMIIECKAADTALPPTLGVVDMFFLLPLPSICQHPLISSIPVGLLLTTILQLTRPTQLIPATMTMMTTMPTRLMTNWFLSNREEFYPNTDCWEEWCLAVFVPANSGKKWRIWELATIRMSRPDWHEYQVDALNV